ncbi:lysine-specific histone demethylase 1A-like [Zophobas morio]|uniref:lysine-specific histone demethylase 1A-like n=1 Tax=Zophobas morio TaxID=2755281 RepID=UPI003083C970
MKYERVSDPLALLHARAAFNNIYYIKYKQHKKTRNEPILGGRPVDMFLVFDLINHYGGIEKVYNSRSFGIISKFIRLSPTATSAGHSLNRIYRFYLSPIERDLLEALSQVYLNFKNLKFSRTRVSKAENSTLTEVEAAVVEARLPVYDMEDTEILQPYFYKYHKDHTDLYLDVRNHLIRLWYHNVASRLEWNDVKRGIPVVFRDLASKVFEFLEIEGFINFGVLPLRRNVISVPRSSLRKKKVIVVGAGISGLVASRHLQTFGFEVLLLEGASKIGGRVESSCEIFGAPVDLGTMLITGLEQNPMAVLCKQLNIPLQVLRVTCPLFDVNGNLVSSSEDEAAEDLFNEVLERSGKEKSKSTRPDKSLQASVEEILADKNISLSTRGITTRLLSWHIANLEYGCAAPLNRVSWKHWNQDDPFEFEGEHVLVKSGFSAIVEGIFITFLNH